MILKKLFKKKKVDDFVYFNFGGTNSILGNTFGSSTTTDPIHLNFTTNSEEKMAKDNKNTRDRVAVPWSPDQHTEAPVHLWTPEKTGKYYDFSVQTFDGDSSVHITFGVTADSFLDAVDELVGYHIDSTIDTSDELDTYLDLNSKRNEPEACDLTLEEKLANLTEVVEELKRTIPNNRVESNNGCTNGNCPCSK